MAQLYNAPPGTPSDIGPQFNTHYWDRRSLIDAAEQMFFSPLADVRSMPMHYGKEMKVYFYVPLLDDRNVNDQGLDASGAVTANGNMYGSSKDVGLISARMPTLTEEGGRVNRVGFTRLERNGTLQEHGFFTEFSDDMMTFDTDSDLYSHMSREMVAGANEITEDLLQIDLLSNAGTVVYTGVATQDSEITGEGANPSVVTFMDLKKLSIVLDDNRTPKNTKIIKGSTMNDTATINASRIMYIGSDLQITVENMVDGLGNPAFVPVRKYAAASTIMNGEIGSVGDFRIIVVPNMMNWEGAGAVATASNLGYDDDGANYNIFPMLVVGDGSFATVGLQGSGRKGTKQKFNIIVKKPGKEMATIQDPYGKIGFSSITFYHGFIALRPERLAVVKTVAAE
jgi:N4-gp56 family major capsid protein